jgi:hypothetical protein
MTLGPKTRRGPFRIALAHANSCSVAPRFFERTVSTSTSTWWNTIGPAMEANRRMPLYFGIWARTGRPAPAAFRRIRTISFRRFREIRAGRIWCAANSPVTAVLTIDRKGWTAASKIDLAFVFPDKTQTTLTITSTSQAGDALRAKAIAEGFYTLQLTASGMPATNLNPAYKATVTYSAPQTLVASTAAASPSVAGKWEPRSI